jgi:hypothetical protein
MFSFIVGILRSCVSDVKSFLLVAQFPLYGAGYGATDDAGKYHYASSAHRKPYNAYHWREMMS